MQKIPKIQKKIQELEIIRIGIEIQVPCVRIS